MSRLSPPGLPRPRTADGRYPIPWVSPPTDLSQKDSGRQRRVASGWVCQVCGLRLEGQAIAFGHGPWPVKSDRMPEDQGFHAMDHGLLHERCARIALANCPALRDLRSKGLLVACRVPAGCIEAFGSDVQRVGLDALVRVT